MDREQIMQVIRRLAKSQGFYSRMLEFIIYLQEDSVDSLEAFFTELEEQNFKDELDLILYFEQ